MLKQIQLFSLLLCVILLAGNNDIVACSCSWKGPFSEVAKGSKLIVRAEIKDYGPKLPFGEDFYESMEVQITDVIKGEFKPKTLVILGDTGRLCRPYIEPTRFKKGKGYLFALPKTHKTPQGISICGEFWIQIEGKTARGIKQVNGRQVNYTISLEKLLKSIRSEALKPDSKLQDFYKEIEALVKKHYPKADFKYEENKITFEHAIRDFMIHLPRKTGERQDATTIRGPMKSGILCNIELRQGKWQGTAMVPQTFDRFYFKEHLYVPYSGKHDSHLVVRISTPQFGTNEKFLDAFKDLVNKFEQHLK